MIAVIVKEENSNIFFKKMQIGFDHEIEVDYGNDDRMKDEKRGWEVERKEKKTFTVSLRVVVRNYSSSSSSSSLINNECGYHISVRQWHTLCLPLSNLISSTG